MGLFRDIFTWWNSSPVLTRIYAKSKGKFIGEDEHGNRYYEIPDYHPGPPPKPRRWVIYNGYADASKVTADWYGWLHYITDTPPNAETYHAKPWQKPHVENLTGTPLAYHPPGSLARGAKRAKGDDYQPWDAE